jgi:ketosteroid isomerase-like protein
VTDVPPAIPPVLCGQVPWGKTLLRAEVDAVLADWAWHLDHGDYDALVELFTENALFVTGAVELHGRSAIKNRYTERVVVRSTRHTYSGLRVSPEWDDSVPASDGRPARVRARSTWVNFAVNAPAPVDDVGVYLVADFDDVLTWCADDRWRISERRIIPVFRDPSRAPVAG